MRRVLAAAVAMVAMACGPEAPVDTGLDDMGLMAWRGNVEVALHLDAAGAPRDVADRIRMDIARRARPGSIQNTNVTRPFEARIFSGYCSLVADTRSNTVSSPSLDCALADTGPIFTDAGRPVFLESIRGTLSRALVTRTASEIRIATTWGVYAGATGERPQPWEGQVSITYVLTR